MNENLTDMVNRLASQITELEGRDLLEYGARKTVALSCRAIINWTDA